MPSRPTYYKPVIGTQQSAPRQDNRPTAPERGYDGTWSKLRNWYIRQHPICQWPRCTQAADIVDHIIPIREDPNGRLDQGNLQSLCRSHHGIKTARDQRIYKGR